MAKNLFSVYPAFADFDIAGTACTAPQLYLTAYGVAFRHTVSSHTAGHVPLFAYKRFSF